MNRHILVGNCLLSRALGMDSRGELVSQTGHWREIGKIRRGNIEAKPTHFRGDRRTLRRAAEAFKKAKSGELDKIERCIVANRLAEIREGLVNIYIANAYRRQAIRVLGPNTEADE